MSERLFAFFFPYTNCVFPMWRPLKSFGGYTDVAQFHQVSFTHYHKTLVYRDSLLKRVRKDKVTILRKIFSLSHMKKINEQVIEGELWEKHDAQGFGAILGYCKYVSWVLRSHILYVFIIAYNFFNLLVIYIQLWQKGGISQMSNSHSFYDSRQ